MRNAPTWSPPVAFATAEDGHQEVAVCEAILKSHRAKVWVKV